VIENVVEDGLGEEGTETRSEERENKDASNTTRKREPDDRGGTSEAYVSRVQDNAGGTANIYG
jgi:hypothetical protein